MPALTRSCASAPSGVPSRSPPTATRPGSVRNSRTPPCASDTAAAQPLRRVRVDLVYSTILRSACFTLGRGDSTARKKRSGTGNDQNRCRGLPRQQDRHRRSGGIPVCQRTCVKNGSAVCQAHCDPDRTHQSALPHRRSTRSPTPSGSDDSGPPATHRSSWLTPPLGACTRARSRTSSVPTRGEASASL